MRSSHWLMFTLFAVVLTSACSHTTSIVVKPSDSRIYVDENYVGTGRARAEIGNSLMGPFQLRVESPSAGKLDASIPRFQPNFAVVGLVSLVGGVFWLGGCAACVYGYQTSPNTNAGMLYQLPFDALVAASLLGYNWSAMAPDAVFIDMTTQELKLNPSTKMEVELFWDKPAAKAAKLAPKKEISGTRPSIEPADAKKKEQTPPNKSAPELSPQKPAYDKPFTY